MAETDFFEAAYVNLRGNTNIGGFSASNIDSQRDGYVLLLHVASGGVYASKGNKTHFIPAMSIESVDLRKEIEFERAQKEPEPAPKPAPEPKPEQKHPIVEQMNEDEEHNARARAEERKKSAAELPVSNTKLADEVLNEFNEDKPFTLQPRRAKR